MLKAALKRKRKRSQLQLNSRYVSDTRLQENLRSNAKPKREKLSEPTEPVDWDAFTIPVAEKKGTDPAEKLEEDKAVEEEAELEMEAPAKKPKYSALYAPPTHDELTALKETQNLFKSNLMKLQVLTINLLDDCKTILGQAQVQMLHGDEQHFSPDMLIPASADFVVHEQHLFACM